MLFPLLATLFTPTHATIKDCGLSKSLFKINALGFWPDPSVRNGNSTVSLDYTIPEGVNINGGRATYTVTYNYIPLSPTTESLCSNTVVCPLVPGTYNKSTSSVFPDVTGSMSIKAQWFDDTNNLLLCYIVTTSVK